MENGTQTKWSERADVFLKCLLCIAAIVLLYIIVFAMLSENSEHNKIVYGIISTVITGCIFLPFQHYFPSKKNNKRR